MVGMIIIGDILGGGVTVEVVVTSLEDMDTDMAEEEDTDMAEDTVAEEEDTVAEEEDMGGAKPKYILLSFSFVLNKEIPDEFSHDIFHKPPIN
jgi:hypothetical protein